MGVGKEMQNLNSPSASGPDRRVAERRRDTTRSLDRLLDGAQATFAERGYHLANIHEICARADVGIGTFYAHFDHKNQLLEHLIVERAVSLPQVLSADDFKDVASLAARIKTIVDDPVTSGLWRAWHEGVAEDADLARTQERLRDASLKQLSTLIAKGRRGRRLTGRPHAAAVAWTLMLYARELAIHHRDGAPSVDAVAQIVYDLVFGSAKQTA
jgi:AcrR family transcriptional regulator